MAWKKYCDRCGIEIKRKSILRNKSHDESVTLSHDDDKNGIKCRWVLCRECGNKFIMWLNELEGGR